MEKVLTKPRFPPPYLFLRIKYLFENKKVLDVGCGNGWFSIWADRNGCSVDAIDPSAAQIKDCKDKDKTNKINFMVAGAENINDLNNCYDSTCILGPLVGSDFFSFRKDFCYGYLNVITKHKQLITT